MKKIFPYIIALSALSVSASAAFYSVFGLSKLFAGASTQVIIMAGSLEVAKLVIASVLYQYWKKLNILLKGYLMIACFVLILITSGGIYGYLSGAYQATANQSEIVEKELAVIEMKRSRFNESREELKLEKLQLVNTVKDLRLALSNPAQVQYIDRKSGQLITTTSSSARRALKKELDIVIEDRDKIGIKLEAVTDSIAKLDISVLDKETSNEAERELGPLIYLAELTGTPMNKIINFLLLLIIFVFDPLAISLVVVANQAFAMRSTKERDLSIQGKRKAESVKATQLEDVPSPEVDDEGVIYEYPPDEFKFKPTVPEGKEFNVSYPISELMKDSTIEENENIYGDKEIRVDIDGDGNADIILKDTDGDGKIDTITQVERPTKEDGRTGGRAPSHK